MKKIIKSQKILDSAKNIYLVGIKGVGMTALAQILQSRGKKISGSDTSEKFFTDEVLKKLKIPFQEDFRSSNLPKRVDLIIYSTAFNPETNPELQSAQKENIPLLTYPQAVSSLFNSSLGIAISGTHGKTTTSALIANSLKNLHFEPNALIGSRVIKWETNALTGKSPLFVIEADEHQNKIRLYDPWSIILTNIDYDHPDFYKKESNYYQCFKDWVKKWSASKIEHNKLPPYSQPLPKIGILNGDDPKTKRLIEELKLESNENCLVLTYGKSRNCNFRITDYKSQVKNKNKSCGLEIKSYVDIEIVLPESFFVSQKNKKFHVTLESNLIGEHNAYNLAAAFGFVTAFHALLITAGHKFKTTIFQKIASSLSDFEGTERRMQFLGEKGKVLVFDDYAHHPSEIKATLSAVKNTFPTHQLFVIFQPHTYSRTQTFLQEFAEALMAADEIGLLEIYGSAREREGNISSKNLQKTLLKKEKKTFYFSSHADCVKFLKNRSFEKTVLITMGAGDGWRVGKDFLKK